VLFHLHVRDTQVGLKLFRREVLAAVLPRIVVKRYAFDLELLVVAHHLGFSRVVEAPVRIGQRFSSTINRQAIASILWETAAIFYRKNVLRYYDHCHIPGALDSLSAVTEAELVTMTERERIARHVVRWLLATCAAILRSCYTSARARFDHEAVLSDRQGVEEAVIGDRQGVEEPDEERWRARV
jgi:hypothetical protein